MARTTQNPRNDTFNFRVDASLKAEFVDAASGEQRSVAEVLREFMADYVARRKRERFRAEARRQSLLISKSPDEAEVMDWIRDVTGEDE